MASATDPLVEMRCVRVVRSGRAVLRDVDWTLMRGEVHALAGEHRSGKSTLAGLLSGEAVRDSGSIFLAGNRIDALTPRQARRLGVGVVGQESRLVQGMSVAENILLGGRSFGFFSGGKMHRDAGEPLRRLGVDISPSARMRDLPADRQRMVELAKAIVDDPAILILDEVSQRFTPTEMEKVYQLMDGRRREGKSVVFVCRTVDEALELSDRVTFVSGGRILGTEESAKLDRYRILTFTVPSLASRENLRQANIELYNYKRYNESLIRNLPVGVVIVDPDRRIHLANQRASELFGVDSGDLVGRGVDPVFPADLRALIGASESEDAAHEEEMEIDGTPVRAVAFPFRDENGGVLGSVALLEDITSEERMKSYLIRVERMRSAAELAAGVAHEINNPLTVIRNYVELLKRQPDSAEAPKRLDKIGEELDWIVEIVGGMLSFARPGETPLSRLDLAEVAKSATVLLGYKIKEKAATVTTALPETPVWVVGNENRLKQLFVNLLANAIEAVPADGEVHLRLTRRDDAGYVEAAVEDNGPGIPEEAGDRVFNPFFTTKTGRHNTGLGLSICQQIAEAHQGVLLYSRRDGRTVFSLRLRVGETAGEMA